MSEAPAAANNPAGRALWFLRELRSHSDNLTNQKSLMSVIAELFDVEPGSTALYRVVTRTREDIELVPKLMEAYAGIPGYASIFKHYEQPEAAAQIIQVPGSYSLGQMLGQISSAGWASLEFADEVLRGVSTEKQLSSANARDYLEQVQGLITEVVDDGSLSAQDRDRIVRLLSEVEQALRQINILGAIKVEEAAVTVAGVIQVEQDLWERVAGKKWYKRFGKVIGGLLLTLGAVGGLPAIESAVDDSPTEVVVVATSADGPKKAVADAEDAEVVEAEIVEDSGS